LCQLVQIVITWTKSRGQQAIQDTNISFYSSHDLILALLKYWYWPFWHFFNKVNNLSCIFTHCTKNTDFTSSLLTILTSQIQNNKQFRKFNFFLTMNAVDSSN
jgi:hypothetical protein